MCTENVNTNGKLILFWGVLAKQSWEMLNLSSEMLLKTGNKVHISKSKGTWLLVRYVISRRYKNK